MITTEGKVRVSCSCGTVLNAPAAALGKSAPCPKCGVLLTVTDQQTLDPIAEQFLAAAETTPPNYLQGAMFCMAAGVLCLILWVFLGWGSRFTAVGTGILCGFAMFYGAGQKSPHAGLISAIIAIGSILGAHYVVYRYSDLEPVPEVRAPLPFMCEPEVIAKLMVHKQCLERNLDFENPQSIPDFDEMMDEAESTAQTMNDVEREQVFGKLVQEIETLDQQRAREHFTWSDFNARMISGHSILWMIMAMIPAFCIAAFGDGDLVASALMGWRRGV